MLFVVTLLMGAFMTANRANFNALGASQRHREAQLAADSALNFCWFELAHNQFWAKDPFNNNDEISPSAPGGPGLQVWRVRGRRAISGRICDDNATGREPTFTVEFHNNLANQSRDGDVPADSVLLTISAHSGPAEVQREVLLTGSPIYTASLTANSMIDLQSPDVKFSSEDPMRNWVLSNGSIHLPDFVNGNDRVRVETASGGPKGAVWAREDIKSGDRRLQGDLIARADERSGGLFTPNSKLKHDIYKLRADDLKLNGESVDDVESTTSFLDAGTYVIDDATIRYLDANGTEQHGAKILRHIDPQGNETIYYNTRYFNNPQFPGHPNARLVPSDGPDVVKLGHGPGNSAAMTYNFQSNEFKAVSQGTIQVHGDLTIYSQVELGYLSDEANRANFEPKIDLASEGNLSGTIRARGDISIQGSMRGGGGLIANGDIVLMANSRDHMAQDNQVDVNADTDQGVVLYGENINIVAGNTHSVSFKGLIYAENDVHVMGGVQAETTQQGLVWHYDRTPLQDLYLEGAVVAHSGSIHVTETAHMEARYNERYLKEVTRGLYTTEGVPTVGFRKLERLWVHEN